MNSPIPVGFELKEKVAALELAILERHPKLPILLREIWFNLKKQPENVTLLTELEMQSVVKGLEIQTGTFLADSVSKSSKSTTKVASLKSKGADAF